MPYLRKEIMKITREALKNYVGCILGGAVGDALGAPVEFMSIDQIRSTYSEQGIADYDEAYGLKGAFTDDTQMTLFTAEGILRGIVRRIERGIGGAEVAIVDYAYERWFRTQTEEFGLSNKSGDIDDGWLIGHEFLWSRRAPGNTCLSALASRQQGNREYGTPVNNDSKGCGTVMRVAPVGLTADPDNAYQFAKAISFLTHGHPTAATSAGALAYIISELVKGSSLSVASQRALKVTEKDEQENSYPNETSTAVKRALDFATTQHEPSFERVESLGLGWVAEEALAISLYCALVTENFRDGVLLAINHSGDSDSTGAITGNLLGLMLGEANIPGEWKQDLEGYEVVHQIASDLFNLPREYFSSDFGGAINQQRNNEYWGRYPGP